MTDRNLAKKYRQYGDCLEKRTVTKRLEKLLNLSVAEIPAEGLRTKNSGVMRAGKKRKDR